MNKYIFPTALIILDLGAAIVYALNKDYKMATYWIAAAVLNICVTFQANCSLTKNKAPTEAGANKISSQSS